MAKRDKQAIEGNIFILLEAAEYTSTFYWWDKFYKISCECKDLLLQSFQTPTKSVKVEQTKIVNWLFSFETIKWKCIFQGGLFVL